MGFVVKSVFWLGVVYSAMPFEPLKSPAPQPTAAVPPHAVRDSLAPFSAAVKAASARLSAEDLTSVAQAAWTLCGRNCSLSQPPPGAPPGERTDIAKPK